MESASRFHWDNQLLGNNGRYYSILRLSPIPLIVFISLFIDALLFKKYSVFPDKFLFLMGLIFCLYHIFKIIKGMKVISLTIKKIEYKNKQFYMQTFSGKSLILTGKIQFYKNSDFFINKNIKFMFPENNNISIVSVTKSAPFKLSPVVADSFFLRSCYASTNKAPNSGRMG